MQKLRYSINVTLDGCIDHTSVAPSEDIHRRAATKLAEADSLLFGRVTYELMQAWRPPISDTFPEWTRPFARTIGAAKKYVVSSTLESVDWNSELVRGDLGGFVRTLKAQPGNGIYTGGVMLPKALAEMGLIDEYEFWVHPRIVGRGPSLFAGLTHAVDLKLVGTETLGESGAVVLRYNAPTSA